MSEARLPESYELAGMLNASGTNSLLAGSLPFGQLHVPKHIDIAGDALYYWDDPEDDYKREEANGSDALDAFIRIKTSDQVMNFARRYGPLRLCKHGLPPMHRRNDRERRWCPPCGTEPIRRWFDYIGRAKTCLDFVAVTKSNPEVILMPGVGKMIVQDSINEWLGDASVSFELNWKQRATLQLTGVSVFGALGVQLLSAVTSNTMAVCSGCGLPYFREGRMPQSGRHNYCPECGKGVANKLRQRERRAKLRNIGKNSLSRD